MYDLVKGYFAHHKHYPCVKDIDLHSKKLGVWIDNQYLMKSIGHLSEDHKCQLE